MIGTRQILHRRRAVESVEKITRTMEMISTARYKAYYARWDTFKSYHDGLATVGYLLVTPEKPLDHPLLKENSSARSAILAVGSKRGFCGMYNAYIYQLVKIHINRAKRLGNKLDIYAVNKKLINLLNHHGIRPVKTYDDIDEIPSDEQIEQMASQFIEQYMSGQLDYFGVIYTRFYSASSQHAQTLTVMPLTELIYDLTTRTTAIWPWKLSFEDFSFSPPVTEMIEYTTRMIINSSVQGCLMDAALSEHAARMVAMKNATENAEDMIEEMTAEYNRSRQNQITRELLDIISGAEATQ